MKITIWMNYIVDQKPPILALHLDVCPPGATKSAQFWTWSRRDTLGVRWCRYFMGRMPFLSQGVYKSNQTNFQEISRRHFILSKLQLQRAHWSCLTDGLYLILADNYLAATLIPRSVRFCLQREMRNIHNHHHYRPNSWTRAKNFYDWMP